MDLPYRSPQIVSVTVLLTDTGTALADHDCAAVLIQADPDNTVNTLLGHAAGTTPIELTPGQSFTLQIENTKLVFVKNKSTTATQYVNYLVLK